MAVDELELLVEGARFTGWKRIEVQRQLEAASGQFSVTVSDRNPLPIAVGQEVTVRLAGTVVLRGFVDTRQARGDARTHEVSFAGRDRTADLVDCSELSDPGTWEDLDLQQLVELIARPFGVEVRNLLEEATQPFERFARNSGETAWSAIERACRLRGVLAHSSGDGALILTRPGRSLASVSLIEGRNVKSYAVQATTRERFSSYVVRAQSSGSDDYYADQAALIEGTSTDPGVERFRPLLVLAEGALTFEGAADRARWEATVRAARAATASIVTPGWRQLAGGPVWDLNQLCQVVIGSEGLDQVLLVNGLTFSGDEEEGTTTQVELTRSDAYDPQPEVDPENEFDVGGGALDDEEGGAF